MIFSIDPLSSVTSGLTCWSSHGPSKKKCMLGYGEVSRLPSLKVKWNVQRGQEFPIWWKLCISVLATKWEYYMIFGCLPNHTYPPCTGYHIKMNSIATVMRCYFRFGAQDYPRQPFCLTLPLPPGLRGTTRHRHIAFWFVPEVEWMCCRSCLVYRFINVAMSLVVIVMHAKERFRNCNMHMCICVMKKKQKWILPR